MKFTVFIFVTNCPSRQSHVFAPLVMPKPRNHVLPNPIHSRHTHPPPRSRISALAPAPRLPARIWPNSSSRGGRRRKPAPRAAEWAAWAAVLADRRRSRWSTIRCVQSVCEFLVHAWYKHIIRIVSFERFLIFRICLRARSLFNKLFCMPLDCPLQSVVCFVCFSFFVFCLSFLTCSCLHRPAVPTPPTLTAGASTTHRGLEGASESARHRNRRGQARAKRALGGRAEEGEGGKDSGDEGQARTGYLHIFCFTIVSCFPCTFSLPRLSGFSVYPSFFIIHLIFCLSRAF